MLCLPEICLVNALWFICYKLKPCLGIHSCPIYKEQIFGKIKTHLKTLNDASNNANA